VRRLVAALVVLALPLAALALNVHLLASEAFLRWEYGRPGFPPSPGVAATQRLALALPGTQFIVNDAPPASLAALSDGSERLYQDDEIAHLVDVRAVVRRLTRLGLVALAVLVLALVWAAAGERRLVGRALARGGALTVGLVLVVGAGIALAWPWLFVTFHRLFFPEGTWQFALESGLIRLFPDQFWYDTALALAGLTAFEGLLAFAAGRWLARP
jgi:integral membrane protein (TIGR01906 family)